MAITKGASIKGEAAWQARREREGGGRIFNPLAFVFFARDSGGRGGGGGGGSGRDGRGRLGREGGERVWTDE